MSSAECRYYLRWAPVKLVVAILFSGIDAYRQQGLTFDTVFIVVLTYGLISALVFFTKIFHNWIIGIGATALIFAVIMMMDMPSWARTVCYLVFGFLGPVMDIVLLIMLARASKREKDLYNTELAAAQHASSSNATDEIMKYKQLLDAGAITQEEYDIKKKQILGV